MQPPLVPFTGFPRCVTCRRFSVHFIQGVSMTKPLRSIILAAVTALVVGALPGAALAVPCDSAKDCGSGMRCDKPDANKAGVCVGTPGMTESAASNPCETSKDCPAGSRCSHKYKGKPGGQS